MSERSKNLIRKIFLLVWLISTVALLYKAAHTPLTLRFDLTFILELLDVRPTTDGLDNFVL